MADSTPIEKLQPCLLDRLTDDQPDKITESGSQSGISEKTYKEGVKRDLNWLFNAQAFFEIQDKPKTYIKNGKIRTVTRMPCPNYELADYPEVRRSVLNFGIKHVFGLTAPDIEKLADQLQEALEVFEPRIYLDYTDPEKLPIDPQIKNNLITIGLNFSLWVNARMEQMPMNAIDDLETGQCLFRDGPYGPATA